MCYFPMIFFSNFMEIEKLLWLQSGDNLLILPSCVISAVNTFMHGQSQSGHAIQVMTECHLQYHREIHTGL